MTCHRSSTFWRQQYYLVQWICSNKLYWRVYLGVWNGTLKNCSQNLLRSPHSPFVWVRKGRTQSPWKAFIKWVYPTDPIKHWARRMGACTIHSLCNGDKVCQEQNNVHTGKTLLHQLPMPPPLPFFFFFLLSSCQYLYLTYTHIIVRQLIIKG